jgi:hypothetical protein
MIMKSIKLPKIGKRGWTGVVAFVIAAYTFLTARSTAQMIVNTPIGPDTGINAATWNYADSLASELGYASCEDYYTAQYRKDSVPGFVIGAVLVVWGFWKYSWKNSRIEKSQNDQVEKPTQ